MSFRELEHDSTLEFLYSDGSLLIPVKVDVTAQGCRFVDSFCWNLLGTVTSFEFAGSSQVKYYLNVQVLTAIP
jgi:hypothetical protein